MFAGRRLRARSVDFEKISGFAIVASTSVWMECESLRLSKEPAERH